MGRKAVPQETQDKVLAACRRRCAICFGLHDDMGVKRGQIAHLDRDATNPALDNLVFLCLEHHDQYDSRTSQSKGLTPEEVRQFREELIEAVAHLAGENPRPTPDLTSAGATPALATQRAIIREKSAAEILANLKGVPSYRFHEKVEELYLGRWTPQPWQAIVDDLPSKLSEGHWYCFFKEVGSGALVSASTTQDISKLRPGDSVTISGSIRDVSQANRVGLEDAIVSPGL
jgi:hypothetical protein